MSDKYDIHPAPSDLDWESFTAQEDAMQEADEFRCKVVGAHRWITVCSCCGKEQSRFTEYMEYE